MHILIVDDCRIKQVLLAGILKDLGHTCDIASDGAEAISALEKNNFSLVLMDCWMKVIDGIEATRIIRSPESKVRNHDIPIVCISSHAVENKVHFCLKAGIQEYLEELSCESVASVISRWA